jgi:DNA repair exonuclease SbcCD ATPase subunit
MPTTVSIEGQDHEFYTPEEVEATKAQAIEEYKSQNPDKSEEIQKLQDELKAKEEQLLGLKDKDMNFSNIRKELKDKEDQIKLLKQDIEDKVSSAKKEILEGVMKDHYLETLKTLSGGDKELADKIEFQYKRLGDTASTKEEIFKKLKDAFVLASGGGSGVSSSVFSSGGVSPLKVDKTEKLNDAEKEVLAKLARAGGMNIDVNKL